MQEQIIKRLELLKNLLFLEDWDDLSVQIQKLRTYSLPAEVNSILELIEQKNFTQAATLLHQYLKGFSGLVAFSDPETIGLRQEAQQLETQLTELNSEKSELNRLVYTFNLRYNKELGDLTLELLRLKMERLLTSAETDPTQRKRLQEAQAHFDQYHKKLDKDKFSPSYHLSENEQSELKAKYRKATKLCHPDVVAEAYRHQAQTLFNDLRTAYEQNDLARVTRILDQAEKGFHHLTASESISDKQKLKTIVIYLHKQIESVQHDIIALKQAEAYRLISDISDWDVYFNQRKLRMQAEIELLRAG